MARVNKNTVRLARASGIGANRETVDHLSGLAAFSCKYLDLHHGKFNCQGRDQRYYVKLLERLAELCRCRVAELQRGAGLANTLRLHAFEWEETTEREFGIPDEDQLVDKPFQFSVSSNEHGRVHGFFIDRIFYVCWLDPDHRLFGSCVRRARR